MAGLVAGAMSMAAGEYVSVHSQADSEQAEIARERRELEADEKSEHKELMAIYVARGLEPSLAKQVAEQLMAHDSVAKAQNCFVHWRAGQPWLSAAVPSKAAQILHARGGVCRPHHAREGANSSGKATAKSLSGQEVGLRGSDRRPGAEKSIFIS